MRRASENNDNANATKLNELDDTLRYIQRTFEELERSRRIEQRRGLCTELYDALVVMFLADNVERFEPRKCLHRVQLDVVLPSIEFEGLLAEECSDATTKLECCFIDNLSLSQLDEVASELKAHGESLYASLFQYCELRAGMAAIEVMLLIQSKTLQQIALAFADEDYDEYHKYYSIGLLVNKPDGFKENFIKRVKKEIASVLPPDNTLLESDQDEAVYALCFQHMICLLEQVDFKRLAEITEF